MKQLLLRVPDELHRSLALRAEREGRSVNSLATEVLAVAASVDVHSRRDRLRLRATSLGLASHADPYQPGATSDRQREDAVEAMRGAGPMIDSILDELRR